MTLLWRVLVVVEAFWDDAVPTDWIELPWRHAFTVPPNDVENKLVLSLSAGAGYLESFTDDCMEIFVDGAEVTSGDASVSEVVVPGLSSTWRLQSEFHRNLSLVRPTAHAIRSFDKSELQELFQLLSGGERGARGRYRRSANPSGGVDNHDDGDEDSDGVGGVGVVGDPECRLVHMKRVHCCVDPTYTDLLC